MARNDLSLDLKVMEDFLSHENRFPGATAGAWFGMNKAFRNRIKELGITTSQYTLMRCLHESQDGISQDDLPSS